MAWRDTVVSSHMHGGWLHCFTMLDGGSYMAKKKSSDLKITFGRDYFKIKIKKLESNKSSPLIYRSYYVVHTTHT